MFHSIPKEYLHYFLATKYFPEVAHDDLYEAIDSYQNRGRRYGE